MKLYFLAMKIVDYFCSKDCPDCCPFQIKETGFKYINTMEMPIEFVCKKLPQFYNREINTNDKSFILKDENKTITTFEKACDEFIKFLQKNQQKKILYLRGSGSLALNMSYYDKIFPEFENIYFVDGNICDETGITAHIEDFGNLANPDHTILEEVNSIILFGKNCKVVSPHFYAYLKYLKRKGKKIVYIDPIFTSTAKLADKYIRINPATDGILAASLIFPEKYKEKAITYCGISEGEHTYLKSILQEKTGIITGWGLQRYSNGKNIVNWINKLAVATNNEKYLFFGRSSKERFKKPEISIKNRIAIHEISKYLDKSFFDAFIIVAANPVITYPTSKLWEKELSQKFLIVIDTNYTETAKHSNIFIKVGGMFAQEDAMGSYFFNKDYVRTKKAENLPNDTDVISFLSKKLKIKMEFNIEYLPSKKRGKYNNRELKLAFPKIEENKLRLLTMSNYHYLNSQLSEKCDEANYCFLHPDTATRLKVKEKQKILIKNANSEVIIPAKITNDIHPSVVMIYKNKKIEGQIVNSLTNSIPTDSDNAIAIYDTFVEVIPL